MKFHEKIILMITSIVICAVTCITMIVFILTKPSFKLGKVSVDTYWIIALMGAIALLVSGQVDVKAIGEAMIADSAVNPLKILVLFVSMTILSIYLDELGFFSYLANFTLKKAKASQFKLFLYLYLIVSVLTIFTSNDVIILSFTPFICYFAKNAKIDPIPYLAGEFVSANTWSMALIIGNPTNIYLATANGIDFLGYLKVMILPTIVAGLVAFGMLLLIFGKKLKGKIEGEPETVVIKDKVNLIIGIVHLALCTLLLAIGSYIKIEMWMVSLGAVASLFLCVEISSLIRHQRPSELIKSLSRAPWQLIPFVLSMFVLIIGLAQNGVTEKLARLFGSGKANVFVYGLSSFVMANVINNIPMSVLYSSIIGFAEQSALTSGTYASIIGSNIGAFLTPIGALAGIMWTSILKKHKLKFGYANFLFIGVTVAVPTILASLLTLWLILL